MRTLCLKCHRARTAELRERLRKRAAPLHTAPQEGTSG
jgi:hypothetical protein